MLSHRSSGPSAVAPKGPNVAEHFSPKRTVIFSFPVAPPQHSEANEFGYFGPPDFAVYVVLYDQTRLGGPPTWSCLQIFFPTRPNAPTTATRLAGSSFRFQHRQQGIIIFVAGGLTKVILSLNIKQEKVTLASQ